MITLLFDITDNSVDRW